MLKSASKAAAALIDDVRPLILASGSRYRAELLSRLRIPFLARASHVDETPLAAESPATLVRRLARAKAAALSADHPECWILGSDQAAAVDNAILGKPGTRDHAHAQLALCSGREVRFLTAVALLRGAQCLTTVDVTTVRFRRLGDEEIARYLEVEDVLDCAGSFKCEGYGITLFETIDSRDPTALIGLPLIGVRRLLAEAGIALP
ncbi:MAG: nucleoside triphosphate pyrophosphatase [Solimonas sp.]